MSAHPIASSIVALGAGGLAFGLLMLVRNVWVYRTRVGLIGSDKYDRLPSYDAMMWRFWIWSADGFLTGGK